MFVSGYFCDNCGETVFYEGVVAKHILINLARKKVEYRETGTLSHVQESK